MSDGLLSRVRRLVAGGVSDMIDTIENAAPETILRESIREIEKAANDVRDELGRAIANRHHANKRLMETTTRHEQLAEKAAFAIEQGRDDLAEAAIARQLDMEAQVPVLETTLKEYADKQTELEGYVSALVARKREMEADLATFLESRATSDRGGSGDGDVPAEVAGLAAARRVDSAEGAFNRVLQSASGVAATSRADSGTSAKLAELENVARDQRIKERLAALKVTKEAV